MEEKRRGKREREMETWKNKSQRDWEGNEEREQ